MRSRETSSISPRNLRPLVIAQDSVTQAMMVELQRIGIDIPLSVVAKMITEGAGSLNGLAVASDALNALSTTPSITTPIQFLQSWLPGFVRVLTQARKIDELTGVVTQGRWEDEEVVQGVLELVGNALPYGDYTNVPLSSWNANWERRSIVRFEEGIRVGKLEEARAAAMNGNSAEFKREAAAVSLDIQRNRVGFYGYNNGANRTYGFLNDPSLPAYVTVPVGTGGDTEWSTKTFLEITADIRSAMASLRTQSGDIIDPDTTPITLALPTNTVDYLGITNQFGTLSVRGWLKDTYPNVRIVSAPELNGANGGENVFYLYAETVPDSSTDDGRSIIQVVPTRFMSLGVEQQAKAYVEDYTNATAGVMVKRPYAFVRRSGI